MEAVVLLPREEYETQEEDIFAESILLLEELIRSNVELLERDKQGGQQEVEP